MRWIACGLFAVCAATVAATGLIQCLSGDFGLGSPLMALGAASAITVSWLEDAVVVRARGAMRKVCRRL
jgi:acid phosphatase family membrane protein YuiD